MKYSMDESKMNGALRKFKSSDHWSPTYRLIKTLD